MNAQTFLEPSTVWMLVACFACAWLGLGYMWSRKNKNTDDFLFAGRGVGLALGTTTIMASWVTGNTALSAPEIGFRLGIWGMLGYAMAGPGIILFIPIGERIKKLMPNGFTAGDFMRVRFGRSVWILYLIVVCLYTLGFLVTQAKGGGILLESLAGIEYHKGMIAVISLCVIYTFLGGMKAVIGTDFVQSLIIIFTLLVVVILAFNATGPAEVYDKALALRPENLNLLNKDGLLFAWNNWIFGIAEVFIGALWWQRLFAMRKDVVRKAFTLSTITWMTIPVLTGLIAFIAIANEYTIPQVNMIFPIVASNMFGTTGAVLVFFIVFASLSSTLASLFTSTASILVKDVYQQMFNQQVSDQHMMKVARGIIVALGFVAVGLAWNRDMSMYMVLLLTGPLISSVIFPLTYGIFSKRTSSVGSFWAILLGTGVGVWSYFAIGPYSPSVFSLIVSGVVLKLGTKWRPDNFDWNKFKEEDSAAAAIRERNDDSQGESEVQPA